MTYGTVNVDTLTSSDGGTIGPNITSLRNRIINGAMMIDQRNAGASVTAGATDAYCLDRWKYGASQASKYTVQQSSTAPAGFTNSMLVTSSSAYSVVASDYFRMVQQIEGFNTADLNWGSANAQAVTLSFWVRSSLTGTFGGSLMNSAANYSYPFSYTISAANTWEQKSITIAGPTSGTWIGATNAAGIIVQFGLGVGSTYSGTAGSWSANLYVSSTGATSVVGTNGATFYITGVQLEKGSTATSFDYRPYGTELQLCQRYYQTSNANIGVAASSGTARGGFIWGTTMRAQPTIGQSGVFNMTDGYSMNATQSAVDLSINTYGVNYAYYTMNNYSGFTTGRVLFMNNTAVITLSAEL